MLPCNFQLIEQSEVIEALGLSYRNIPAVATTAIGEMVMSVNMMFLVCLPITFLSLCFPLTSIITGYIQRKTGKRSTKPSEGMKLFLVLSLYSKSLLLETQLVLYDGLFCRYMWQIFVLKELIQMS